jgi:hypothetical protein
VHVTLNDSVVDVTLGQPHLTVAAFVGKGVEATTAVNQADLRLS